MLGCPHELWSRAIQRVGCKLCIAGGERLFNLTQKSAHAAAARSVDNRAPFNLSNGFLGRLCIGHICYFLKDLGATDWRQKQWGRGTRSQDGGL